MKNPTPEFSKIEEFFGLENELEFRFNRTKGFPCLHRPVPYCLSAAKGMNFSGLSLIWPISCSFRYMLTLVDYYQQRSVVNICRMLIVSC